jgi:drug/metabolite transporter (DMT)-like permease
MHRLLPGLMFAALWASASVATKFGVAVADPLILANVRFFIAGVTMLLFAYAISRRKHRIPHGKEWRHLFIFSLLNTTVYLGAYVIALKYVSAGIGSLAVAISPLLIMVMSALWLKRKLRWFEVAGLILGLTGVVIASYPLLQNSHATVQGLLILLAGLLSVSVATVYYAGIQWKMENIVINGWQVLIGGILLLPFTLLTADFNTTNFNYQFWGAVFWLVVPVSIAALQLWFFLVKQDAVRASLWLFLCPVFGFVYAATLLDEPITGLTYLGTSLVISGLYLAQREKIKSKFINGK